MTLSVAVVCESAADQRTGCGLADRIICHKLAWVEDAGLDNLRRWSGLDSGESFLSWVAVKRHAKFRQIRVHGHYDDKPAAPDAHAATRALWLLSELAEPPDAVILLRDADRQSERAQGLAQARADRPESDKVVIGLANRMRECWVIAGFEPKDDREKARLAELIAEIDFNPLEKPDGLTGREIGGKRSPKRVLFRLTDGDFARESECWMVTDLEVLRYRGKKTGLPEYLQEIEDRLVPLLGYVLPGR